MEKKELKPKIRFKGFNGCYTINKLKNIASFLHGKGVSWSDVSNNGIFECILYGNLYTDYGMIIESEIEYRTNRQLKNPVYSKVGDVLIPSSDTTPTGLARATSIEKENVLLGGGINIIRPNKTVNGSYLSLLLNCHKSELIKLIKGTTVRHIYNEDIKEISLPILDNIDEQTQTVKLIKNIEKIINQSNRRIEKWKNIRTSFLSLMFPKPGSRVPEIRFKGFSGEWTEYKLDEYVEFRRGSFPQPYGKKEWYDGYGAMPFVQVIDVTDNMKLVDDTKQKISLQAQPMSVLAKKGQVVVTLQGTIGRVAVLQYDAYIDRTLLIFENYNYDTNIDFFAYIIKNKFDEEAKKAPGGIIKTITKEALSSFIILLPSIEEQKAIVQFLLNFDKNIEYQQQKLEKLIQIKQSFLSKMFV